LFTTWCHNLDYDCLYQGSSHYQIRLGSSGETGIIRIITSVVASFTMLVILPIRPVTAKSTVGMIVAATSTTTS
jgi:hypothetical protein